MPDGNTSTSVQIILDEFLPTYVYSRSEYEKYEIKDIISFAQFILKTNFKTTILWLCNEIGVEYDESKIVIRNQSETIKCLQQYIKNPSKEIQNKPVSESFLNQYPHFIVDEWIQEGISSETQKKYDIRIDKHKGRWLIPIRDENNILVAIKGRTYLPNHKELGIPKYIYYKEDKDVKYYNNTLFGLNYHMEDIKNRNEVIFLKAKSVMKAEDMDFIILLQ